MQQQKPKAKSSLEQRENQMVKVAGVAVVVVIILVVAFAAGLLGSGPPLPASVRNAPLCTTDTTSVPPCGMSATDGTFVVTAAQIQLSKAGDGSGNLTLTVYHTGIYAGSEIYASVTPFGLNDYVQVLRAGSTGQSNDYSATIPSKVGLVSGQTYEIQVVSLFNGGSQGAVTEELYVALTPVAAPST